MKRLFGEMIMPRKELVITMKTVSRGRRITKARRLVRNNRELTKRAITGAAMVIFARNVSGLGDDLLAIQKRRTNVSGYRRTRRSGPFLPSLVMKARLARRTRLGLSNDAILARENGVSIGEWRRYVRRMGFRPKGRHG